ncbi:stress-inducible protein [Perilla frutescens var. hirtella]|uniref:Stress-inducible protein n=1 Tax=Perilla frutescens var. hirtella TaxID=608512 RepID=A0AAD4P4M1_PERFH|nr:stress-inducible protein [Perilla frutescens var. hirtella]
MKGTALVKMVRCSKDFDAFIEAFQKANDELELQEDNDTKKLLEFLTIVEQRSLTKSMNDHHVIQYCLKNFSIEDNKHILNVVIDNYVEIALDKNG